ncbi:MAG: redox-sensing transcriptional repressor Rex [Phycisphaerales bacterium]|jgi:redox-sensing transcriptional repressor|nr:redox-sensing transcriptional repressor Rex [Phycisphaerales bacterium]
MADKQSIPKPTARRLSLYLRELEALREANIHSINSKQLGDALDITSAQVRKDFATFGTFGRPGVGYTVIPLCEQLRKIMGTNRTWDVAVVGAGKIGQALSAYSRFVDRGFQVIAVFDSDPQVVGTMVANHRVRPVADMTRIIPLRKIRLAVLSVPAIVAQDVTDRLVASGITGILNFAPIRLTVPDGVGVSSVDFSRSLEQLALETMVDIS